MAHSNHRTAKPGLMEKAFGGLLTTKGIINSVDEKLCQTSRNKISKIEKMIGDTFPDVEIHEVKRVQNGFLEAMYLLKKAEYESRYSDVEEKLLFHVTSTSNAEAIAKNNFDWRQVSRGRFGLGTSFADDAIYANAYANYDIGDCRAIIVTKVLMSNITTKGRHGIMVPPGKYDTTFGNDTVYVKFSDNEFLPKYVAYYTDDL